MRLEQELGVARVGLEPLRVGPAETVLEVLRIRFEPAGEPRERLARRPRLAPFDLADVLLREASTGELGLAQPGGSPQRAHTFAQGVRATFGWRFPVLHRHATNGGTLGGAPRVSRYERLVSS